MILILTKYSKTNPQQRHQKFVGDFITQAHVLLTSNTMISKDRSQGDLLLKFLITKILITLILFKQ